MLRFVFSEIRPNFSRILCLCYGESSSVVANSAGGTNTASPLIKDTDRGEICPAGYYCPEGSYAATAWPAGTYNQFTGMKALSDCLTWAANTYNDLTAQTGCQPWGEFAYSLAGAQTCTCYGAYRSFGKSDSSCRCQPRYVYRKEDKTIERYNVSKYDCIPLQQKRTLLKRETIKYYFNKSINSLNRLHKLLNYLFKIFKIDMEKKKSIKWVKRKDLKRVYWLISNALLDYGSINLEKKI